jgi:hypothetical protein
MQYYSTVTILYKYIGGGPCYMRKNDYSVFLLKPWMVVDRLGVLILGDLVGG